MNTENRIVEEIVCPKCGEISQRRRKLKNGKWMVDHLLPFDKWMIPGIPQGTSCILSEEELKVAE